MSVTINKLEIENVKRVKAVKLEPSSTGLTIVGGKNNQGKTSVLDGITQALGGDRYRPSQPQREGSVVPPFLHVELSNGVVVERKGKNSDLKVIDKTGNKAGQQLLNEFIEQLALDLPKFMQSTSKEKANTLLQIIGVGPQLYEMEQKEKFCEILNQHGFRAEEVNGESKDREQILKDFDENKYNVLCNSMLLTEGWDSPAVDCVVVLRPTKVRSLYAQMVGRGTRLSQETNKTELLLLDFLWHTERHELCHPAHLICESEEVAKKMTENIEKAGCPVDIEEAEHIAAEDVVAQREEALAKQLM